MGKKGHGFEDDQNFFVELGNIRRDTAIWWCLAISTAPSENFTLDLEFLVNFIIHNLTLDVIANQGASSSFHCQEAVLFLKMHAVP